MCGAWYRSGQAGCHLVVADFRNCGGRLCGRSDQLAGAGRDHRHGLARTVLLQFKFEQSGGNITELQLKVSQGEVNVTTLQTKASLGETNVTILQTNVATLQANMTQSEAYITSLQTNVSTIQTYEFCVANF
jgi:hypothetical protein